MYISNIQLTLHSNDAEMLFRGGVKTKEFIPGFYYCQKRLNALFAMGLAKNPYAEAALIEIDYRLKEVTELTEAITTKAQKSLSTAKSQGIEVALLQRDKPYIHAINYATEYTSLLARMVSQADKAFLHIRTAHSSGYLPETLATDQIRALRRKIRMVFDRIIAYAKIIQPGITREDILNKTAKALGMIEKLGTPNDAVMAGTVTFEKQRITELAL